MWIFLPLMIQSLPFRTAVVESFFSEEPAPGSEMDSENTSEPSTMPGKYFFFCVGVPPSFIQRMPWICTWLDTKPERHMASVVKQYSGAPPPRPPHFPP